MTSDKTNHERLREAARAFLDNGFEFDCCTDDTYRLERELREAIDLPPDPPRGDGWEAMRALLRFCRSARLTKLGISEVIDAIDLMLAVAPKETP